MGLEIGFNLYKKSPFDERREFVESDIDTQCVCGRTKSTGSWGELFNFTAKDSIIPVFQKELDGYVRASEDYTETYMYTDFNNFKSAVMDAVNDDLEDCRQIKQSMYKRVKELQTNITELRELQKSCTEDNSYAFDRWEGQIQDYAEAIRSLQRDLSDFEDDDYQYGHAVAVQKMLEEMEKYVKENEYYVIPFFSY